MSVKHTHLPSAAELIEAVAEFLERDLLPTLDGRQKFNTRVSVNALRIARRELDQPAPASPKAGLQSLLGAPDAPLETLLLELAARIRAGDFTEDDPRLLALLRAHTLARLAVDSPKYAGPQAARGD